jgi:membrane-associated phospholipid phosphatase
VQQTPPQSPTSPAPAIVIATTTPEALRPRPDPFAPESVTRIWPLISTRTTIVSLCLVVIAMGWDRAGWLALSHGGKPIFKYLGDYARIPDLFAALFGTAETPVAISEQLAALAYASAYHFGRLWIWIILSVVVIFSGWFSSDSARVKRSLRTGVLLILSPALGGLFAEALKLLTRRLRPEASDGFYAFRAPTGSPFSPEFYDPSNLSFASSHASVAVAGALAAAVVFPRFRFLFFVFAILTCLSRLLVGAHYLSDVLAGAMLGALAFRLVSTIDARNNQGRPLQPLLT